MSDPGKRMVLSGWRGDCCVTACDLPPMVPQAHIDLRRREWAMRGLTVRETTCDEAIAGMRRE